MDPAGFGIEQAAGGQGDAGEALGLLAVQAVQQVGGEGCGQLRLALRFLGVEGQLQYAAGVQSWPRRRRSSSRRVWPKPLSTRRDSGVPWAESFR
ncbi:Uncharacterised protein [Pseudomonas aeruginosa]|nr:Uncharacterised protein [Pseudomonas aeruginosa]